MRESITADKLLVVQGPSNQFITNKSDAQSIAWDLSWQQTFWKCNDKDTLVARLHRPRFHFQLIESPFQYMALKAQQRKPWLNTVSIWNGIIMGHHFISCNDWKIRHTIISISLSPVAWAPRGLSASVLDSGPCRTQTRQFPTENSFLALWIYKAEGVLLPLRLQLGNILWYDMQLCEKGHEASEWGRNQSSLKWFIMAINCKVLLKW